MPSTTTTTASTTDPEASTADSQASTTDPEAIADDVVRGYAETAAAAAESIHRATDDQLGQALSVMGSALRAARDRVAAANAADIEAAVAAGMSPALLDRLSLGADRIEAIAANLQRLAQAPAMPREVFLRELPGGLRLVERRRPVGVVGVNFEARPNVTIDVASQLVKSRNAGVLRTGSAALRSAAALVREVIAPALMDAGIDAGAIQLVEHPGHEYAAALVHHPALMRLVILRGSGETTAALGGEAARHGVRTLAHAEGGGVLYVDAAADPDAVARLLREGVDRLGVCNRVNLVLVGRAAWDRFAPLVRDTLSGVGVDVLDAAQSGRPLGHEWALDDGQEATVTIAPVEDEVAAARLANRETSGLAATIATEDPGCAERFLDAYHGTGAFWNATTRLLDGDKLLGVPETGINVDHLPGPRGPVTFADLCLRQYVIRPMPACAE